MTTAVSQSPAASAAEPAARPRFVYVPAVGPRLKVLLWVIFGLAAVLGANSLYLAAITFFDWIATLKGENLTYQNYFFQWMVLGHLVLGILLTGPLVAFGIIHIANASSRPNRRAVRMGYALFATCLVLLVTGFLLMRVEGLFEIKSAFVRNVAYWLHVLAPLAAVWLYILHRLAGPRIKWRLGGAYAGALVLLVGGMVVMHVQDPRQWNVVGPKDGEKYYFPSLARPVSGGFIPQRAMMMDNYCKQCHPDAFEGHMQGAHRFSSFNNPAYLFSVLETRREMLARHGNINGSRWCAGCHDPVPFFTGAFDQPDFDRPDYDFENDPAANAGITCTVCHSITNINDTRGNANYTIEEAEHYPFAFSENAVLQYINRQLIRAKPAMHKKTFLKPFHKTAEFCSVCHKVHLPPELNDYKWTRGQNHFDTFMLSGVSGHGARSFYYPDKAKAKCAECHMPAQESDDFGAHLFAEATKPSIHNHMFVAANTAIGHWKGFPEAVKAHQEFLKDCVRIDLFGIRQGSVVTAPLVAPLRTEEKGLPELKPGGSYLLETVVRTLRLGHDLTQGTADSNELWVEVVAHSGGRVIGHSGGLDAREVPIVRFDEQSRAKVVPGDDALRTYESVYELVQSVVDPYAYHLNAFVLDQSGYRIDRRNAQDIFVPLYDHQIPPGAAAAIHYRLDVPDWVTEPIEIEAAVRFRKFDSTYLRYVFGKDYVNDLPITTLASDRVTLPVVGGGSVAQQESPIPLWQRWNDYGIGLLRQGEREGSKGELLAAAEAFQQVERLGRYDGPLHLARVYDREGRFSLAIAALDRSRSLEPKPPDWTWAWLRGMVHKRQGELEDAARSFGSVLEDRYQELRQRNFDFSQDYLVINQLGHTLFLAANQMRGAGNVERAGELLEKAAAAFQRTLALDSENLEAHHNLALIYEQMGDAQRAELHRTEWKKYRPDEDRRGIVATAARIRYPWGDHAAEPIAIYPLAAPGAATTARASAKHEIPSTKSETSTKHE